ncbi:zinc ribbon domain-containing protein, partial [Providencia rustigianii]|uniref:zinc ribbon domain-containing protein n=1 Tax=Providencia rustigianii TaxID=158850 RepID=UPI00223F35C4
MKALGIALLIIGSIAAIASFSMEISVATGYGNRVNNIGLMSDRQNFILISCFIILCGLLVVIFGKSSQELAKCPYCAENISLEAIKCKHCKSNLDKRKIQPSTIDYSFTLSSYD